MIYTFALHGVILAAALCVVACFFCELEIAPKMARRMARAVRDR